MLSINPVKSVGHAKQYFMGAMEREAVFGGEKALKPLACRALSKKTYLKIC